MYLVKVQFSQHTCTILCGAYVDLKLTKEQIKIFRNIAQSVFSVFAFLKTDFLAVWLKLCQVQSMCTNRLARMNTKIILKENKCIKGNKYFCRESNSGRRFFLQETDLFLLFSIHHFYIGSVCCKANWKSL